MYSNFTTYLYYKVDYERSKRMLERPRTIPVGVELEDKSESLYEKVFFVMGESSTASHYSLYGYDRPTTPFLDSLSSIENSPLKYYDAVAPACITTNAIRQILSFANPLNMDDFYKYKWITELANDVGYETIWISNQETVL